MMSGVIRGQNYSLEVLIILALVFLNPERSEGPLWLQLLIWNRRIVADQ